VSIIGFLIKPLFRNPPVPRDTDDPALKPLARVVNTVLDCGFFAIANPRFDVLVPMLESRDVELQGFAYEGAGMGLAIRDCWMPWMHYTRRFAAGPAARWQRAVYLGAGLGFARMGRDPQRFHKHLPDRFWSWCIFDGYGYLKGILGNGRQRYLEQCAEPEKLRGYARQAFDQGMGRGIWFLEHGNPEQVGSVIQRFPERRQPDLWSGVGYACAYAGGGNYQALEMLGRTAGPYAASLGVGVAASARTRHTIGNPVEHNDIACAVLCRMSSIEAARLADEAMRDLPPGSEAEPPYEIWRGRLRDALQEHFAEMATGRPDGGA
jgi:enediyne biosynthesis protein E3